MAAIDLYNYPTLKALAAYISEQVSLIVLDDNDRGLTNADSLILNRVSEKLTIHTAPSVSLVKSEILNSSSVETNGEGIAIIALGGIFPEASDPNQLWSHIASGKTMENVVKVDGTSFSYGSIKEPYQEAYIQKLGLTKSKYASMSRQQKLIFTVLGQALQENDLLVDDLNSQKTGVFIGAQQVFSDDNAEEMSVSLSLIHI